MDPADIGDIIQGLRASRSLPWLRVLDDADLNRPVADEPAPQVVIAPYQWLLRRIGTGVRLTQAGYLPPALVTEAMSSLGWEREWIGKHNREDLTPPILELRESAQRLGLLRKNRGDLLVTKVGRDLTEDPAGLWWHLAGRLPGGRTEPQRQGGLLYLLMVAAGRPDDDELLAEGMTILGWAGHNREPLSPSAAFSTARDTWAMFRRVGLAAKSRWKTKGEPPGDTARRLARAAILGRGAETMADPAEAVLPHKRTSDRAVQLKVTVSDIEPEIWRRVVVPASLTLRELHAVLQTAVGWDDIHLHLFDVDGVLYGDIYDVQGVPLGDEETFTVADVADAVGEFSYDYDFGDSWRLRIAIEQIMPSVGIGTPHLLDGARAGPPEDCGGVWGYERLVEILADPSHEEYAELLQWVGGGFDPEAFDLAAVNEALELYDRHTRQRRLGR